MDYCGELPPKLIRGASCHQSDTFCFVQVQNMLEDLLERATKLDEENKATIARLMNDKAQLVLQRDQLKLESYVEKTDRGTSHRATKKEVSPD